MSRILGPAYWLFLPGLLWAQDSPQPLSYKTLAGGTVVVSDGSREVGRIQPRIFTGADSRHWDGLFAFKDAEPRVKDGNYNGMSLVNGVRVTLLYEIEPVESGLHITYRLVPTAPVTVSWVQVYSSFPYADWKGMPYDLEGDRGLVPENHSGAWLLRDSDSAAISMGPSPAQKGLAFRMVSRDLHLRLVDDQSWGGYLSVLYSHQDLKTNWVWAKGEAKDFDFTLTFNRPMASPGTAPAAPLGSLPSTLIDDFEDQNRNGANPHRLNLWGSPWNTVVLNSSIGVTFNAPGLSSRYSAGVTGYTGAGSAYAIFQCPLLSSFTQPVNVACHGLKGVQFWIKGDGNRYRVEVPNAAVTDGHDWYGYEFTAPADQWDFFQIPFDKMTRRYMGNQGDLPESLDGTDVSGIQFFSLRSGAFEYNLDDVGFYGDYLPQCRGTPGITPSASTPTATETPYPADCLDPVIDDFEAPLRNGPPPSRTNRWGGQWGVQSSPEGPVTVVYGGPANGFDRSCAGVSGKTPGNSKTAVMSFHTGFFANGSPFDARAHGIEGVQFWMKGDLHSYWFCLYSADHPNDPYCVNIVPPANRWTLFRIPFRNMALKSWWGDEKGGFSHPNGTGLTEVGFESRGGGPFAFWLGEVSFYRWVEPNCPKPMLPAEPTLPFTPTAVPPTPNPTPTPLRIIPPPSPTPAPWSPPRLKPTPTPFRAVPRPTPVRRPKTVPVKIRPALPPHPWRPTRTPTPLPTTALPPFLMPAKPGPTPIPTWLPHLDLSQAVNFNAPPANIYVEFADGPGQYRVEVVDAWGNRLETIFDGKVVGQNDQWLEWDGLDGKGKDAPTGQYFIVIYKDGKALRSLSVLRLDAGGK